MKTHHEEPFQKIPDACRTTGLSQFFLRKGCRDGTVPHVRSGRTYYVDVPALLDKLSTDGQTTVADKAEIRSDGKLGRKLLETANEKQRKDILT